MLLQIIIVRTLQRVAVSFSFQSIFAFAQLCQRISFDLNIESFWNFLRKKTASNMVIPGDCDMCSAIFRLFGGDG